MCGIVGGVSLKVSYDFKLEVGRMSESIAHRGPDGSGIYIDERRRVCFGHRRLAILDLSELGHQPLKIDNYIITYNGEIYNYLELRVELESIGVQFYSQTDTEVVLKAYIQWGDTCVSKFNGMWSFAIYNELNHKIFCSRDRFGIKPFYYTLHQDRLYFASEIKAFLVLDHWVSKLNLDRAYDFLSNSLISHTPETLLDGVWELRGGHNLTINIDQGTFFTQQYYSCYLNQQTFSIKSEKDHTSDFEKLLRDAVRISLRSDVKVGSALSGGLDSSTIVAIVNEQLTANNDANKQECVSAVYTESDKTIDESYYIDALALEKQIHVHKVQPNWEHLMANIDKMLWHQDEPVPTLSIYAQYAVFEEASRRGLTVMLDGQGADEILGGYESFYIGYFNELIRSNPILVLPALTGYLLNHRKLPTPKIWYKYLFSPGNQNWFNQNFTNNVKPYIRRKKSSVRGMSEDYLEHFGLHSLLKYEDRNSMAFSIESRVPFLDFRVVEYSLALPTQLKINKGIRKYILREAFRKILPNSIYLRFDKLGFPTPQERWSIENVDIVTKMLFDTVYGMPEIFNTKIYDNSKEMIKSGNKDFIYLAWRIILFGKWMKLFKVQL